MNQMILNRIQELFFAKLETKTGWGRNDIKAAYKDAVLEALKEYLDTV
ncbi:MAG: hypothetical protein V4721_10325 [Bacteroidota bacterium]